MFRHFVPPRELHSLATLKRLSRQMLRICCVLAVRKQHKMLFAASKFDSNKSKFVEAFEWLMNQKALSESGWIILKA